MRTLVFVDLTCEIMYEVYIRGISEPNEGGARRNITRNLMCL